MKSCDCFKIQTSYSPYVSSIPNFMFFKELWSWIIWLMLLFSTNSCSGFKVAKHHFVFTFITLLEQNILGSDITMHKIVLMQLLKCSKQLKEYVMQLIYRESVTLIQFIKVELGFLHQLEAVSVRYETYCVFQPYVVDFRRSSVNWWKDL